MRTIIGYVLLGMIFLTALYAYFHPPASAYAMSIVALAVAGGIMLRRGRDDRRRRERTLPEDPKLPTFPPLAPPPAPPAEDDSAAPKKETVPAPAPEPWKERDVIIPPSPNKSAAGPVLRLVHTDGRRADVRDFRRKAAK
ncbi:MAG TPA: hypothetical protein VL500_01670 [Candidatus Eisenbacteria bacterium]|jgi:hypothetical protein|nr:hypothetical protein [Candidatus Eisenbacteria bacterium]